MNVLIVGGAGFVGSNLAYYLLEKYPDYRIINIDKKENFNDTILNEIQDDVRHVFHQIDIKNEKLLFEFFKFWYGFDIVINCTEVSFSIVAKDYIDTNITGTINLLEVLKRFKPKKYIQISSTEVYGNNIVTNKLNERSPVNCTNIYSSSKASSDIIAMSYYEQWKMPTIIARTSNNYGQYQKNGLVPLIISSVLNKSNVKINESLQNTKDWLHVFDFCRAMDTLIHYGKIGEIYNICSKYSCKNIEITNFILSYMGIKRNMLEFVQDMSNVVLNQQFECSKLETFGWQPIMKFNENLIETIEWFKTRGEK